MRFNSILVQLEGGLHKDHHQKFIKFSIPYWCNYKVVLTHKKNSQHLRNNSIMVQLEVRRFLLMRYLQTLFQFHIGAIRSYIK